MSILFYVRVFALQGPIFMFLHSWHLLSVFTVQARLKVRAFGRIQAILTLRCRTGASRLCCKSPGTYDRVIMSSIR